MTSASFLHTQSTLLPQGYTQRAATADDANSVAHLRNAASQARGEAAYHTADLIIQMWENPLCDLPTSSQVIVNPQGEIVACLSLWDQINPTHPWYEWDVMPGDDWSSLTRVLLDWGEQRSMQALSRCQPDERFGPAMAYNSEATEHIAFFESLGYQKTRYFYRMSITLQHAPAVSPLPQGFTLRTFAYPADLEAVVIAREDMWQDHYAYVERSMDENLMTWKYGIEYDPLFDANLWFIATDDATGEIAGMVLCRIQDPTNAAQGYVHTVGVRRAYRKHGLAQAMLTHAFAEFWARDQKTITLGVDASSPTGAIRLYERVGMKAVHQSVFLEKELRAGVERMSNTGH